VDWIDLAWDRGQRRALVNMVMNFQALWNLGKFLSNCTTWMLLKKGLYPWSRLFSFFPYAHAMAILYFQSRLWQDYMVYMAYNRPLITAHHTPTMQLQLLPLMHNRDQAQKHRQ
jgi:hypothetical protein